MKPTAMLIATLLLCSGCGSKSEAPAYDETTIAPGSFQEDSVVWRRKPDLAAEDQSIIDRFLRTHTEWRDSTALEGTPLVYASGDDRRYYWIRPAQQVAVWTCLHWEQKRFRITGACGALTNGP